MSGGQVVNRTNQRVFVVTDIGPPDGQPEGFAIEPGKTAGGTRNQDIDAVIYTYDNDNPDNFGNFFKIHNGETAILWDSHTAVYDSHLVGADGLPRSQPKRTEEELEIGILDELFPRTDQQLLDRLRGLAHQWGL